MTGPVRILVVDDNDDDRTMLRRLLRKSELDAEVIDAGDADAAVALCRRNDFDCVLLDYKLAHVDGLELIKDLMSNATAVIMLTGCGNEVVAVEAMKRGARDYLLKDELTPADLRRAVAHAVDMLHLEMEVREKSRRLEEMSLYDALTGLPNRNLFFDRLEQVLRLATRERKRFAVFMMDLNLFKEVNDTHGHDVGDDLLRVVAERLQETLRESDTAARLGGDEFAALVPSIDSLGGASILAQRIRQSIAQPMLLGGRMLEIGISIGVGFFPDHGQDAKALLHAADMAMYEAKRGQRHYVVSDGGTCNASRVEHFLLQRLEEGIERDEFVLHYQPEVDLESGEISGAEALVRWNHPDRGLLPPSEFIPGAERSTLLQPLTMLILERAVAQAVAWQSDYGALPIAVNLSPRLLSDKGLPKQILDVLGRYGLPPHMLTLEITETGVMADAERASDILRALDDSGVRIAIDDFGAGFTSLRYLRELPVAVLKIDQMFIRGLQAGTRDASIIRSISDLAHALGIAVVSEGIETDEAQQTLSDLGCDFGQGFAIGRPMPPDGFAAYCAERAQPVQ
jgi:diguanylate cyclase (GGDEF)-like protein